MPPETIIDAVREGRSDELPAAVREVAVPSEARFLLRRRLPETAQQFLTENPNHPRARLERYLLLTYPAGSDARAVLEALRSDEYVEYAYSSSPGEDDSEPPPPGDPGGDRFPAPPWHVDLMKFGTAWSKQVGWTLISAIDNGIEEAVKELTGFQMQPVFHIGRPRTLIEDQLDDPTDYEHQLAIGESDLNAQLAAGYRLLGRQGYVVAPVAFAQCSQIGLVALKRFQGPASSQSTGALPDFVILPESRAW